MNPYKVLGVSSDISISELKKVYRNLCRKYHPDNGGDATKFADINKAYDMILNGNIPTIIGKKSDTLSHASLFKFVVV